MSVSESINNLSLIENGLLHIEFELNRSESSMFRVARESHLVLYRSMIEALKGPADIVVTRKRPKHRIHRYYLHGQPWKEIHKVAVAGCSKAWRFSQPTLCQAPDIGYINPFQPKHDGYLISFYDALAMIQSENFMRRRSVKSREVTVTDAEMNLLEQLHEEIRNVYEHFVPSGYAASVTTLAEPTILCLRLSKKLLFDSRTVFLSAHYKELARMIDFMSDRLKATSKAGVTQPP
jgi:hypothetical protein